MPYLVTGVVEATYIPLEEHGDDDMWFPVLCLDIFTLVGDEVSDYLFNLSKLGFGAGLFANRGMPPHVTNVVGVRTAVDGGADHGHTYAMLVEIDQALAAPGAPSLEESPWQWVMRTLAFLQLMQWNCIPREQWRMIVWGNW